MRVAPTRVARPPKAKAVDVTAAVPEVPVPAGVTPGLFRTVMHGAISDRMAAMEGLLADGSLAADADASMFVYRIAHEGRRWVGLVCTVDPAELQPAVEQPPAPQATDATHAELTQLRWQIEPVVVQCTIPDAVLDLLMNDSNERPSYHFVASTGGTHSAWVIRDHSPYVHQFKNATPVRVLRGAHVVAAALRAGNRVLAVLTRDLADLAELPPLLSPRCGLFVAPAPIDSPSE